MSEPIISGIQQVGIGVSNVEESWAWYKKHFGMEVLVFDERADAEFMLPYTGGTPKSRHAILALNLQGGGGFEVWEHTSFKPRAASFEILPGDLGIYSCKIKCKDATALSKQYVKAGLNVSQIYSDDSKRKFFYVRDPWNNLFQMVEPTVEEAGWMFDEKKLTGGVYGAVVGTDNMEASMKYYSEMLGYTRLISDKTDKFDDLSALGAHEATFRRVILGESKKRIGPFSQLLGPSEIELIQAIDRSTPVRKIFEDRMWGELGFIQICYDIRNMNALRDKCVTKGYPFTVDSMAYKADFDMGEAGGDFAYNEDPAGTLIEWVQTNKVTLLKRFGLALDLNKFDSQKPLPKWMVWCLRFLKK